MDEKFFICSKRRSDLGIMIVGFSACIMIVGAVDREFEGTDDFCTISTHISIESRECRLSSDVWVDGV